ncbi:GNAT family N-acetyltransferase [Streptomyces sp. NPDC127103]|uniref:GNAT family N-acetyltransferase n=1 Tax=Streptomyces sp. NPDC127103 TaxID=3347139 RepID=UPI003659DB85
MSDDITLRPVTAEDLDLFEEELSGPEGAGPHAWAGFQPTADLRRRFAENGLLGHDGGTLAVAEGGVTVGRVKWYPGSWGPDMANWSLAIQLVPGARGRGTGTQAQRLVAEYLFDHTRAERVQAWTDVDNIAEQRALEKAGFAREGVLRSAVWLAGRWRDAVLYSLIRAERPGAGAVAAAP